MANNQTFEREFGWDDVIENDRGSWVLLPEGVYPFTVTGFKRERYAGSNKLPPCNQATLTLTIDSPEGPVELTHRLFLHSKVEGLLCAFFTSIGDRKHGEAMKMDWDHVIGKSGRCEIGIREWIDRDSASRQSNEVKKFLEPPISPAAKTAPAGGKYW